MLIIYGTMKKLIANKIIELFRLHDYDYTAEKIKKIADSGRRARMVAVCDPAAPNGRAMAACILLAML